MRKTLIFISIVTIFLSSCKKHNDEVEVRQAFDNYKYAVANNRDSVLKLIDSKSLNYLTNFENIIKSRYSNRINSFIKQQEAPLTSLYLIQTLSFIASKAYQSDSINPKFTLSLFSLAGINIFSPEGINDFEFIEISEKNNDEFIVKISVKNHFQTETNNVNIIKKFPFKKENGGWKINAISYFTLYDKVLTYRAKEMNMRPEEYIKYISQHLNQEQNNKN